MTGDPIAGLRSAAGSLISVYVGRPAPGGFGALLSDLVKPLRERSESLGRRVQKSVRADTERIHGLAGRFEVEIAPAYAIFASALDDLFVLEPLAHPTPSMSTIGPRPYLRPLRAAPRALRSGILVADRAMARTYLGFAGIVEELQRPLTADIGKRNYGGFAGYEEQGIRAHADEETSKLWREAGSRLLEEHQREPFDYLAIGAHGEAVEEVSRTLHPYLARLHRTSFVANPHGLALSGVRTAIATRDADIRRQRQSALAGRVCDTAWSGGNAVVGLTATLNAANTQAIDTLVVAGRFGRPGAICDNCGHLARQAGTCGVCGSAMFAVEDIVAAVMDATVANGGAVFQIDVPSPLDPRGIGALTRFTVVN